MRCTLLTNNYVILVGQEQQRRNCTSEGLCLTSAIKGVLVAVLSATEHDVDVHAFSASLLLLDELQRSDATPCVERLPHYSPGNTVTANTAGLFLVPPHPQHSHSKHCRTIPCCTPSPPPHSLIVLLATQSQQTLQDYSLYPLTPS